MVVVKPTTLAVTVKRNCPLIFGRQKKNETMNYPYTDRQTWRQWLLNTVTPSMWFRPSDCECCWQYFGKGLMWIIFGGCPRHD